MVVTTVGILIGLYHTRTVRGVKRLKKKPVLRCNVQYYGRRLPPIFFLFRDGWLQIEHDIALFT